MYVCLALAKVPICCFGTAIKASKYYFLCALRVHRILSVSSSTMPTKRSFLRDHKFSFMDLNLNFLFY